jgi:hypothetical protein
MVEPLPRWAKAVVAALVAAGLLTWVAFAAFSEDSPWCDDGNAGCPEEVLVDGDAAAVSCIVGEVPASARGAELEVEQRDGDLVTAWAIESVPTSALVELGPDPEWGPCEGTWVAIGPDGSQREVDDLVAGLGS